MPLWDFGDSVTGVWVRDGRLEFIEFIIEAHEEYFVLAHTEQGLWATVFVNLYEDRDDVGPEAFREAARVVGFRFFDRLVAAYESSNQSTFQDHELFLRTLVDAIDADADGQVA